MKTMNTAGKFLTLVAAALLIGGCGGSMKARNVEVGDSPLINPELLQKGTGDEALYRYVKPGVDVKQYNKVMVDPVIVRKDGELDQKELENYQKLANNAYVYLVRELEKDYTIVQTPQPGTLRVQMAIIDADSSKPVRNTLSTVMPIGIGLSLVKYGATGKQSGVGEITSEMKITDASTGELLGAALDRRVGGKDITKLWSSWYNADSALQYWAKRLSYVMCDMRGGGNCVKP
jgi:hypothetical protein